MLENQRSVDDLECVPGFRMEIDLNSTDFQSEWKRCNMVANYVSDYISYEYKHRELAENLFSTIINEFLEAINRIAVPKSMIHFVIISATGSLQLQVTHECQLCFAPLYVDFIHQVSQSVDNSLYLNLLVGESLPSPSFNQLGLAMIVHDFGSRIEVEQQGNSSSLRTTIFIPTKDFAS